MTPVTGLQCVVGRTYPTGLLSVWVSQRGRFERNVGRCVAGRYPALPCTAVKLFCICDNARLLPGAPTKAVNSETNLKSRVRPLSKRGEQRRAELIEVAARLFARQGFDGTSLQQIADEVGVLKGSIYHYITTKEELLFEVIAGPHEDLLRNMATAESHAGSPLEKIAFFSMSHLRCNNTPERLLRAKVLDHDLHSLPADDLSKIAAARQTYADWLRQLIVAAKVQGEIPEALDPDVALMAVIGTLMGPIRGGKPRRDISTESIADQLTAYLLAGLRGEFGRPLAPRGATKSD